MKNKKSKIITTGILLIAVICFVIFAVGATDDTTTEYWKVVQMDVDTYRADLDNLTAPVYDESGDWLFAGWFTDETCTTAIASDMQTDSAYAKFVPANILGLKAQVNVELSDSDTTNDDTKTYTTIDEETDETVETVGNAGAIRFVTSVDTLNYSKIGFKITRGTGEEEDRANNKVYELLYATGEAGDGATKTDEFKPKELFNADASTYFKTWTYTKVPSSAYDMDITVTPYWVTLDGTTVTGTTSIKCVNMGRQWKYIFVDDTAADNENHTGTRGCPYATLNDALAHIQKYGQSEGGQVWVLNNMTVTSWEPHGLDVTIKGDTAASKVDLSSSTDFTLYDAATFENMQLTYPTGTVYANGHRWEVASSVTTTNTPGIYGGSASETVENTDVTLLTGTYNAIYGGGNAQNVTGETKVYIGGNVNASFGDDANTATFKDKPKIYGGCYKATVYGDTHLTIGGSARCSYAMGGGFGSAQIVQGTCYVTVEGDALVYGVYGGGRNGTTNNTYAVVKGGTVYQVFGGHDDKGGTVNNANVHILGGIIKRRIYGGSYNDVTLSTPTEYAAVDYASVTISPNATITDRTDTDQSICAVSRAEKNIATEKGVMILNSGVDSSEVGFTLDMNYYTTAIYTHFLVNVEEGGSVTSESGILRITPNKSSVYATVKDADDNVLFQCQGEGTYSLSELGTPTDLEALTVTFGDTIDGDLSGNYVLSYGESSYSYFNTLSDALAAVSTPSVADTTATITIHEENVTVSETLSLTDGDKVILTNADGKNVVLTRTMESYMFQVAQGCSLTIDGTITLDGGYKSTTSIVATSLVRNEGSFTLETNATIQNAHTAGENKNSSNGGALYNTGTLASAVLKGDFVNNYGYRGGAIFVNTGKVYVDGCEFYNNSSANRGGAIYVNASATAIGEGYLTNCVFGAEDKGNLSKGGGAVGVQGYLEADNCTFEYNNADGGYGGAILVYDNDASWDASLKVTNCMFNYNETDNSGAAIDVNGGNSGKLTDNILIENSCFTGNYSDSGSAISLRANCGEVSIKNLTFNGDKNGNADVICMISSDNSLALAGKISKAIIRIDADDADTSKAQLYVNGALNKESDVEVAFASYTLDEVALATTSSATATNLATAAEVIKVSDDNYEHWYISSEGKLTSEWADLRAKANDSDGEPLKILFVGDSLTYYNKMSEVILQGLATEAGKNVYIESVTKGATGIADANTQTQEMKDWRQKRDDKIKSNNWDIVVYEPRRHQTVMSEYFPEYPWKEYQAALELEALIESIGAVPLQYSSFGVTYGYSEIDKYTKVMTREEHTNLITAYNAGLQELMDNKTVYTGVTFNNMVTAESGYGDSTSDLYLYYTDNSHPSSIGSYLLAADFYTVIFGESCADVEYNQSYYYNSATQNGSETEGVFELDADVAAALRKEAETLLTWTPTDKAEIKEVAVGNGTLSFGDDGFGYTLDCATGKFSVAEDNTVTYSGGTTKGVGHSYISVNGEAVSGNNWVAETDVTLGAYYGSGNPSAGFQLIDENGTIIQIYARTSSSNFTDQTDCSEADGEYGIRVKVGDKQVDFGNFDSAMKMKLQVLNGKIRLYIDDTLYVTLNSEGATFADTVTPSYGTDVVATDLVYNSENVQLGFVYCYADVTWENISISTYENLAASALTLGEEFAFATASTTYDNTNATVDEDGNVTYTYAETGNRYSYAYLDDAPVLLTDEWSAEAELALGIWTNSGGNPGVGFQWVDSTGKVYRVMLRCGRSALDDYISEGEECSNAGAVFAVRLQDVSANKSVDVTKINGEGISSNAKMKLEVVDDEMKIYLDNQLIMAVDASGCTLADGTLNTNVKYNGNPVQLGFVYANANSTLKNLAIDNYGESLQGTVTLDKEFEFATTTTYDNTNATVDEEGNIIYTYAETGNRYSYAYLDDAPVLLTDEWSAEAEVALGTWTNSDGNPGVGFQWVDSTGKVYRVMLRCGRSALDDYISEGEECSNAGAVFAVRLQDVSANKSVDVTKINGEGISSNAKMKLEVADGEMKIYLDNQLIMTVDTSGCTLADGTLNTNVKYNGNSVQLGFVYANANSTIQNLAITTLKSKKIL